MSERIPCSLKYAVIVLALIVLSVAPCHAQYNPDLKISQSIVNVSVQKDLFEFLKQGTESANDILRPTMTKPQITPFPTVTAPGKTAIPTRHQGGQQTGIPSSTVKPTTPVTTLPESPAGTIPPPMATPVTQATPIPPPGGSGTPPGTGPWTVTAVMTGLLLSACFGYIVLLQGSIRRQGSLPGEWWKPYSRVIAVFHGILAIIFTIVALSIAISLQDTLIEDKGIPLLLLLFAPLAGFAAVSSLGMAYFSLYGSVPEKARTVHAAASLIGTLFLPGTVFYQGSAGPDPLGTVPFLSALVVTVIQAQKSKPEMPDRKASIPDTLLFEDDNSSGPGPAFPPALASRYFGVHFIHQGGIAHVFSAYRRSDGLQVAVKVPIRTDEQTGKSFLREMKVWEGLVHPGIVRVFSANILPVPFVEMEYHPYSLADTSVPVSPERSLEIIRKIGEALLYAHERGVIHRDLKPENILVSPGGEPRIADWGLAREEKGVFQTTLHGFSLSHAAPEQLDPGRFGVTTHQTDIYQLGVIWYWLVCGTLPFLSGSIAEATRDRLEGEVLAPSARIPELAPLDPLILKCLARAPSDRYRDMREFLNDLKSLENRFLGEDDSAGSGNS